jgi:HK97 family phage portal protein
LGVADAVYNNSQMNVYEAALFENKARVDGVFQVDGTVPAAQVERAKEKFAAEYAGMKKAGKSPILPPGMTFTPTTMTSAELSFIEGRKLTREEIAAGFDVPMSLLDPNAIRANVDAAQYHHALYGLTPRLRKIEEKINEKLIPMYDSGSSLFVAFDSAVPSDKQFALQERNTSTGVPYRSINESRSELGLEPVEGGDMPMIPFGMQALGYDNGPDMDSQAADLATRTMKALRERMSI